MISYESRIKRKNGKWSKWKHHEAHMTTALMDVIAGYNTATITDTFTDGSKIQYRIAKDK